MENSVPSPGVLSTCRLPPAVSMINWTVERPSPVPLSGFFVVKKGSKMCRSVSASMPCRPVSLTWSSTDPVEMDADRMDRARGDRYDSAARHRVAGVQDEVANHLVDLR